MAEPVKDKQTVTESGESVARLPAGVSFHDVATQVDDRGWLCEMYDPRWGWHPAPLVYAYTSMIRPGVTKGWAIHQRHEDRYFLLSGELEVVLYDERPESPTRGLVSIIVLSEFRRRLMNIPAGIWHADRNIGTRDAILVNFPTMPFDHKNPDKLRLPLNNERIPHKFENVRGW